MRSSLVWCSKPSAFLSRIRSLRNKAYQDLCHQVSLSSWAKRSVSFAALDASMTRASGQPKRHACSLMRQQQQLRYLSLSNPYPPLADSDPRLVKRPTALVLGSSGVLGSAVSRYFGQELGMKVLGADLHELPTELTDHWSLDGFVELPENAELPALTQRLVQGVQAYLSDTAKDDDDDDGPSERDERGDEYLPELEGGGSGSDGLDVIVVASGGWEGDPPQEPLQSPNRPSLESMAQEYTESIVRMRRMNLDPVIAAGFVAQQLSSNENGLMVVMGATAALSATPGMMGYGLAKTATHHLVQTLGSMTAQGNPMETKSTRRLAREVEQPHPYMAVVGILPTTIDTPSNRKAMPNGKFDQWTKPLDIAVEIGKWVENPNLRPHSGSLVKVWRHKPGDDGALFELVY